MYEHVYREMCRYFSLNGAYLYIFPRKRSTGTEKLFTRSGPDATVQLATVLNVTGTDVSLTNGCLQSTATSLSSMSTSGLKTCFTQNFNSDGSSSGELAKSFSHLPSRWYSGSCKHTFEDAKVLTKISSTSFSALHSLQTGAHIQLTDFYFGLSSNFFPKQSSEPSIICFSGETRGIFFMLLVYEEFLVPRPPSWPS